MERGLGWATLARHGKVAHGRRADDRSQSDQAGQAQPGSTPRQTPAVSQSYSEPAWLLNPLSQLQQQMQAWKAEFPTTMQPYRKADPLQGSPQGDLAERVMHEKKEMYGAQLREQMALDEQRKAFEKRILRSNAPPAGRVSHLNAIPWAGASPPSEPPSTSPQMQQFLPGAPYATSPYGALADLGGRMPGQFYQGVGIVPGVAQPVPVPPGMSTAGLATSLAYNGYNGLSTTVHQSPPHVGVSPPRFSPTTRHPQFQVSPTQFQASTSQYQSPATRSPYGQPQPQHSTSPITPRRNANSDPQLDAENKLRKEQQYRAELLNQMAEVNARKQHQKSEHTKWEARKEQEIRDYNPWGKPGAGAPHRDESGEVVADLRGKGIVYERNAGDGVPAERLYSDNPTRWSQQQQQRATLMDINKPKSIADPDDHRLFRLENLDVEAQTQILQRAEQQARQRDSLLQQIEENKRRRANEQMQKIRDEEREAMRLARDREQLAQSAAATAPENLHPMVRRRPRHHQAPSQSTPVEPPPPEPRRSRVGFESDIRSEAPSRFSVEPHRQDHSPPRVSNSERQTEDRYRSPSRTEAESDSGHEDFGGLSNALRRLRSELHAEQVRVRSELQRQQQVLGTFSERRKTYAGHSDFYEEPVSSKSIRSSMRSPRSPLWGAGRNGPSHRFSPPRPIGLWDGECEEGDLKGVARTVMEGGLPSSSTLLYSHTGQLESQDSPRAGTVGMVSDATSTSQFLPQGSVLPSTPGDQSSGGGGGGAVDSKDYLRRSEDKLQQVASLNALRQGGESADEMDAMLFAFLDNRKNELSPFKALRVADTSSVRLA